MRDPAPGGDTRADRAPARENGMRGMIGIGAALALGACGGGGAGNNEAARNEADAPAPANAVANPTAEEPPALALDHRQLEAACIPPAERTTPIDTLTPARRSALNTCLNTETVRQLTPRLPIRINSGTQLDQARVEGPALVYRYKVAQRLAELSAGSGDRIEAQTRSNACAGEDVRQIIALGGVQIYRWVDRDEAVIREVRIDACPEAGTTTG
jgi:hypothetical protein